MPVLVQPRTPSTSVHIPRCAQQRAVMAFPAYYSPFFRISRLLRFHSGPSGLISNTIFDSHPPILPLCKAGRTGRGFQCLRKERSAARSPASDAERQFRHNFQFSLKCLEHIAASGKRAICTCNVWDTQWKYWAMNETLQCNTDLTESWVRRILHGRDACVAPPKKRDVHVDIDPRRPLNSFVTRRPRTLF
jgi:hypothetical protein